MAKSREQVIADQSKVDAAKQALEATQTHIQVKVSELEAREKESIAKDKKVGVSRAMSQVDDLLNTF